MRLDRQRESQNIEDRRSGGGMGLGRLGIVGLLLAGGLSYFTGIDFNTAVRLLEGGQQLVQQPAQTSPVAANDPDKVFVSKVLASTEDAWGTLFSHKGEPYRAPKLVLFRKGVESGCGYSQSSVGPFYCPADQRLFIDLDFLSALQQRLGAEGDFARAYVVAHEVGHHVQKLLGTSDKVHAAQAQLNRAGANALSVKLELQADCYAGVWAYAAQQAGLLEVGDVEEGLQAASAVGDDSLMRAANQAVVPDAFTHGSSAQRVRWFKQGLQRGDPNQCNTFQAKN